MILLPCPVRPDLDCIAGSVAYAAYLTQVKNTPARAWICGVPDGEAHFYLARFPDLPLATADDVAQATGYVLVDFSVKQPLPDTVDPQAVMQVIDHRDFTRPDRDFPNAVIQIDAVGAAATQITEYYMRDAVEPSPPVAAMLYGAIYTHTLCLNSATTTPRDRDAAAWLARRVPGAADLVKQQLAAREHEIISQMPHILKTEMKIQDSRFGRYGFTLLELQQAAAFWQARKPDIIAWAQTLDHPVVVDILDPVRNLCVVYASHSDYRAFLAQALSAPIDADGALTLQPAWFRKQIIPLLQG